MKILTVLAVETGLLDKNKKKYNKIKLSTPNFIVQGGVKIRIEPKTQNVTKYPESYLPDGSPQHAHDAKIGENLAGDIVTLGGLLPYPITDPDGNVTRMATTASHVVLGNSDDAEAFAVATIREFNSRGKFLVADPTSNEKYIKYWEQVPVDVNTGEVLETADEKEAVL